MQAAAQAAVQAAMQTAMQTAVQALVPALALGPELAPFESAGSGRSRQPRQARRQSQGALLAEWVSPLQASEQLPVWLLPALLASVLQRAEQA